MMGAAQALDIPAYAAGDAADALGMARSLTPEGGLVIATGSVYLVGAVRELAVHGLAGGASVGARGGA
jgi:dihydrofolate synthase/folylpolyglutamate synthase